MTPSRPYLLRSLYEWILDNNMTPHVVIDASYKGVIVPLEHVENGQIILSIAPQSVYGMEMNNDFLSFAARFSGVSKDIYVPMMAVTAIYAEENRKGMVFADEIYDSEDTEEENRKPDSKITKSNARKNRPNLKIVASNPKLEKEDEKNK